MVAVPPPALPIDFMRLLRCPILAALVLLAIVSSASAQVHYHGSGQPWTQRANAGPDAEVPGWFYNLGITGLRVELVEDAPRALVVRYVFPESPAHGAVQVGDHIVGAGGAPFMEPHQNGYGMEVFGARGPVGEFAAALEAAQTKAGKGRLELRLERGEERLERTLKVGKDYGAFAKGYPEGCDKSERVLAELRAYLVAEQREDGSWGNPVQDLFAALALLSSGDRKHLAAVERNARYHARTTKAVDQSSLINWRYMTAAIVLSEYALVTKAKWVEPELQEVYDFLVSSQYVDLAQVNPRVKQTHPGDYPKNARDSHGGWGHNRGFEGYGPISMLTGEGALAFALLERAGIEVDEERHAAAYDFLVRGTGANGYVWYGDEKASDEDWADHGRTGAAGIAHWLAPFAREAHRKRALEHATVIGEHPQSFPDTHGSPILGMGFAALTANLQPESFRALLDANRWWFALAQCQDGTFYYQPNRDNAGYGADSRLGASAVTAFVLSIPARALVVTGRAK